MQHNTNPITLDQIHILNTLASEGSIAKSAQKLKRAHSALLYAIARLEESTEATLIDRSGYRLKLTDFGKSFLGQARAMLDLETDLYALCSKNKEGWESQISLVYDGVVSAENLIRSMHQIRKTHPSTAVSLYHNFLDGVEESFVKLNTSAMITVLTPKTRNLHILNLAPMRSWLVAHRDHPLAAKNKKFNSKDLKRYPFITVHGSDERLLMSTADIERESTFHVADFHTKKTAILQKFGFGWMPEYLIASELKRHTLKALSWNRDSLHVFHPKLCIRYSSYNGKAMQLFLQSYEGYSKR